MIRKTFFVFFITVFLVAPQSLMAQTCYGVEMALGFRSEALLKQAGRLSIIGTEEAALKIAHTISSGEAVPFEDEPVQVIQRGVDHVKIRTSNSMMLWTIPNNLSCP